MPFLYNAWYIASWSSDLRETPKRIKMLDLDVVILRGSKGEPFALQDRCPHRFAFLSSGQIVGDTVQCPYHGLRFDRNGMCVHNPHGAGTIPPSATVRSLPIVERWSALWVWMGDSDLADCTLIPDLAAMEAREFASTHGYLRVSGNYELVTDNLLDLSHVAFLHPFLSDSDFTSRSRVEVRQEGNTVWNMMWNDDQPPTPLFQMFWDQNEGSGNLRFHMRWTPPAILLLDVGMSCLGGGEETGPAFPSAHLLTPETQSSTHYFGGRDGTLVETIPRWRVCCMRRLNDSS